MTKVYFEPRGQWRTPILSQTISDMHLKPDAPYPTQIEATLHEQELFREYIKKFRRSQEHVTLKGVPK